MSARAFLSLLAITVIAFIGAVAFLVSEQIASAAGRGGGDIMFPELATRLDDVSQVTIDARQYDLVLERRDGQWVSVDRGDYPVRADPVNQLIEAMSQLVAFEAKTQNPELFADIDVVGAAADRNDIFFQAKGANGEVLAEAIIGAPSRSIGQRPRGGTFIRRPNEEQAWLAEGTVLTPISVDEWFDQLFTVTGTDVGRIRIFSGPTMLFDAEKINFDTGDYELRHLDQAYARPNIVADDNDVRGMTQAIVSLSFLDARSRDTVTVPADARTVRFETRSGLVIDATLAQADGETWVLFNVTAAEGADAAAQARAADIAARTGNWAFKLQPGRINTLSRDIAQLVTVPVQPLNPFAQPPGGPLVPGAPVLPGTPAP